MQKEEPSNPRRFKDAMDKMLRPKRSEDKVFCPVHLKTTKHWAAVTFTADTSKPIQYLDSLSLDQREANLQRADILHCLNRLGATATPPKKWTSVQIATVPTQKGFDCGIYVNEFARRWMQDADYGDIDESYNGPELRVKQLKATMEEYQLL
jgi:Ulp1 family protease